jgi:hypothetical protein
MTSGQLRATDLARATLDAFTDPYGLPNIALHATAAMSSAVRGRG